MLLPPEAFEHVPTLREKIVAPEKSALRISLATFDEWDRRAEEAGYSKTWRRTHEEREATRQAALADRMDRDLWVFAYGSLMWDPAIHVVEIRRATLEGLHRRFCLKAQIGRGSPDAPSLMAALDIGGYCEGLALRIPAAVVNEETEILWMREMIGAAYTPVFRRVSTPQGPVEALAFAIDRANPRYVDLPGDEAAAIIARGKGIRGNNLDYFNSLAEHLALLGIKDEAFEEIRAHIGRFV
jgi:glutathione-specific gamma-glutamylcyclotransferase